MNNYIILDLITFTRYFIRFKIHLLFPRMFVNFVYIVIYMDISKTRYESDCV